MLQNNFQKCHFARPDPDFGDPDFGRLYWMGAYIVESKNNYISLTFDDLFECLRRFYEKQCREFKYLSSGLIGRGLDEGDSFYVNFFIDKKHVVRYTIPTAIRTYAAVWVGIGPEFIHIGLLISSESLNKFSLESTAEALEINLTLLDEYLAGELK